MTNLDNDYDNGGNNIVPCPICNSAYCPSKEKGKCPEEADFVKAVNLQRTQEETRARFELLHVFNPIHLTFETGIKDMKEFLNEEVEKAFKAGQESLKNDADLFESYHGKMWSKAIEIAFKAPFVKVAMQYLVDKAYKKGQQDMLERVRGVIKRNKEIENWSHSVGSHSDDRGGDSDIECTCREKEVRYKTEALDSLLKALDNLTK